MAVVCSSQSCLVFKHKDHSLWLWLCFMATQICCISPFFVVIKQCFDTSICTLLWTVGYTCCDLLFCHHCIRVLIVIANVITVSVICRSLRQFLGFFFVIVVRMVISMIIVCSYFVCSFFVHLLWIWVNIMYFTMFSVRFYDNVDFFQCLMQLGGWHDGRHFACKICWSSSSDKFLWYEVTDWLVIQLKGTR